MKKPLRHIALSLDPRSEEAAALLMEEICGQAPSVYQDAQTGQMTLSVFIPVPQSAVARLRRDLTAGWKRLEAAGHVEGTPSLSTRLLPKRDWSESWKRHFSPIDLGPRLLVRPTWSRRRPRRGQALIEIDPGLSFGTGQHATTRFCLEELVAHHMPGTQQSLLDAGTGSGILAIAAARLGYKPVEGFDFDPDCVRTAKENCRLNQLGSAVKVYQADLTRLPARTRDRFDVVCANLIDDLLVQHRHRLANRVRPGGVLILAGILNTQFERVRDAYVSLRFAPTRTETNGEWTSGTFRAPSSRSAGP